MSLSPGQKLAHYEVIEAIGKGGMGEVYRARDTKLGRDVAIKVPPQELADDEGRLARFAREATALAALDHPNIVQVFSVERENDIHFITMQLVHGKTLTELLPNDGFPLSRFFDIAIPLADAVAAAHLENITHRDLKPDNMMVSDDGRVKVLDFGLAKPTSGFAGGAADSALPTLEKTAAGAIFGTLSYMSPEQAEGKTVDHRTDIFSLGIIFFEMLTGRRPFAGETPLAILSAIANDIPQPLTVLDPKIPRELSRTVQRCLVKEPLRRAQSALDIRNELDQIRTELGSGELQVAIPAVGRNPSDRSPESVPSTRGLKAAIAVLAFGLIASLSSMLLPLSGQATDRPSSSDHNSLAGARFSKMTDFDGSEVGAAISPDGRFVAFVSNRDGPLDVFVTQIGTGGFRNLTQGRDEFALGAVRSSGNGIGFNSDGSEIWFGGGPAQLRMRAVSLLGGPVRNFLGENVINVNWSSDDQRLVYQENSEGDPIYVADRNGTNSRLILGSTAGTHQHYPIWSTDGQWIYLVRGRPTTLEMNLWRLRPDGDELEQLTRRKLDVRYPTPLNETTVLYSARDADGAGPWLWEIDVETRESRRASIGLEQYSSVASSADRGRLVATVQNPRAELWSVPILDHQASERDAQPFADLPTARALAPRFGGSSLFYLSSQGSGDGLWRYEDGDVAEIWRGSETALLEPAAVSPDGESVVLLLRRDDAWRLHLLSADGAELRVLSESVDARGAAAWSPDGRWVVTGGSEAGVSGLFKIPIDGGASERIGDGEPLNPVWSPNGDLIVYAGAQVNLISPVLAVRPDGTSVELPSIEILRSGERIRFLPDGSGLIYMTGVESSQQDFWLLDLTTKKSRQLTRLDSSATMRTFDVTPSGDRIVFDRLRDDSDIVLIERAEAR